MEGLDEWLPPLRRNRNRLTDRAGIEFFKSATLIK
jgi:hypothetical protein